MPITFDCAGCGKCYTVPDDVAGRMARCKQCGTPNVIPQLKPKQATQDGAVAKTVPPKAVTPPAKKLQPAPPPPKEEEEIVGAEIVEDDEPAPLPANNKRPALPQKQPPAAPNLFAFAPPAESNTFTSDWDATEKEEEQEEPLPRKKFRKKVRKSSAKLYWIIGGSAAAALLVLGGAGAAAYFLFFASAGDAMPAVGRTAPDIEGEDSAGKAFKLSDYRGKVVVLDFWASW